MDPRQALRMSKFSQFCMFEKRRNVIERHHLYFLWFIFCCFFRISSKVRTLENRPSVVR